MRLLSRSRSWRSLHCDAEHARGPAATRGATTRTREVEYGDVDEIIAGLAERQRRRRFPFVRFAWFATLEGHDLLEPFANFHRAGAAVLRDFELDHLRFASKRRVGAGRVQAVVLHPHLERHGLSDGGHARD